MPASATRKAPAKKAAARSGNPAVRATAKPTSATPADEWADDEIEYIELPSGKTAGVELPALTTMISEGLLGDNLGAMAQKLIATGQGIEADQMKDLASDPEKIAEMLDAFDRIAVRCIVEPEVRFYKDDDGKVILKADRQRGVLYSDRIELNDKIYLMQLASGGSRDLDRFRGKLDAAVAGVPAGEGMALPS